MQNQEHYLVVGLGVTGLSVIAYLRSKNKNVSVTDSRAVPPQLQVLSTKFPQVPVILGDIIVPHDITHIVLSPGVALSTPAITEAMARGIPVCGDIELFAHVVDKPVLAITGSNGKSTVTSLLGAMAAACGLNPGVGGNLGTPALDLLNPQAQCYVLELSSFQLETTSSLHCKAATILNITPDHMDRYADLNAYQQAKQRIYLNSECAVINRQDPLTNVPAQLQIPSISFGLDRPQNGNYGLIERNQQWFLSKGTEPLIAVNDLGMLGQHNVANSLAALALGEAAGFALPIMLQTLREFTGLPHRCEKVATANEVLWINDSKGTNVASTIAAISGLAQSIAGKWIIILGGQGKKADFTPLIEPLQKHCKAAILIGEDQQQLWDLLNSKVSCYKAKDLAEVIDLAIQHTQAGDGVLLSPACASLDMFDNYMHRGETFKQQVLQRIGKHAKTGAN